MTPALSQGDVELLLPCRAQTVSRRVRFGARRVGASRVNALLAFRRDGPPNFALDFSVVEVVPGADGRTVDTPGVTIRAWATPAPHTNRQSAASVSLVGARSLALLPMQRARHTERKIPRQPRPPAVIDVHRGPAVPRCTAVDAGALAAAMIPPFRTLPFLPRRASPAAAFITGQWLQ